MKKWKLAYSVLFFGVCLMPLVGMGLTKEEASSENRTLSAFPALKTEEGLNVALRRGRLLSGSFCLPE